MPWSIGKEQFNTFVPIDAAPTLHYWQSTEVPKNTRFLMWVFEYWCVFLKMTFHTIIGYGLIIGPDRREQCDRRASAMVTAERRMGGGSGARSAQT